MEVGGEGEIIYLSLHRHHQNDSCIKMGSDESHFNVSIGSGGQSHKTESTNHNLSEEKGEPKRYRTEVLPLTSLTPGKLVRVPLLIERVSTRVVVVVVVVRELISLVTSAICVRIRGRGQRLRRLFTT